MDKRLNLHFTEEDTWMADKQITNMLNIIVIK